MWAAGGLRRQIPADAAASQLGKASGGPRFHCFQAMARNRRLSHRSSSRSTDGVWQKPK